MIASFMNVLTLIKEVTTSTVIKNLPSDWVVSLITVFVVLDGEGMYTALFHCTTSLHTTRENEITPQIEVMLRSTISTFLIEVH